MQVDPIKPALKAPGTKRLELIYDGPLSNFAFKFNLRRYTECLSSDWTYINKFLVTCSIPPVGWSRLTLSNPR